ncbi:hypothetical protein PHSY_006625 [Pseudozyma hubeiensis SY62]|uniref:Uncharacterized protein n=1 Tax=Pseudozyma hubeiensis (strain SY62) TaxID=1305764 RepID=R9PC86_PSEHS|nr:hypothetical protein PHSY_006625 [Pseudozyma hubeiensis SY62]GAC99028.1 hypothetical protein PHSY_006625 [Pseudozyma hubeiensis SY62]
MQQRRGEQRLSSACSKQRSQIPPQISNEFNRHNSRPKKSKSFIAARKIAFFVDVRKPAKLSSCDAFHSFSMSRPSSSTPNFR